MDAADLKRAYCALPAEKQISVLAWLAHELTIIGRIFYSDDGPQGRAAERDVLIAINELQHQLAAQIGHLADQELKRYPDDVFMDIVFERSCDTRWADTFLKAFHRVLSRHRT